MILTLVEVLCHRAPYYNRQDYSDKVPAEEQLSFYNSTVGVHQMARTQLTDSWKEWARLNRGELADTALTVGSVQPTNLSANETADLLLIWRRLLQLLLPCPPP